MQPRKAQLINFARRIWQPIFRRGIGATGQHDERPEKNSLNAPLPLIPSSIMHALTRFVVCAVSILLCLKAGPLAGQSPRLPPP